MARGLALALVFWVSPQAAKAQVEVDLGSDLSVPGGESFLSLALVGKGAQVGKVISEIRFPKDILSFVEAKRGEAGDQAEAQVTAEIKEASGNSKLSVARVAITAGKELPEGILATLKFKVSSSAPETDVKLENVVKVLSLSGKEIQGAKGNEAILTISPAKLPEVGCFFFTH